jgi:uncharacterized protein involved in type VI secretion and phage assembly
VVVAVQIQIQPEHLAVQVAVAALVWLLAVQELQGKEMLAALPLMALAAMSTAAAVVVQVLLVKMVSLALVALVVLVWPHLFQARQLITLAAAAVVACT